VFIFFTPYKERKGRKKKEEKEERTRGPGVVVGPEKNKGGGTPVKNAEKL